MNPVTLNDLDRQLVHALQIDGRAPFSRIAAVLGASDRTIARRYHRLRSRGALRVVGLLNGRRLGCVDWFMRVQCPSNAVASVATALSRRNDTSWVGFTSDSIEITCIIQTSARLHHDDSLLLQKFLRTPRITSVRAQCLLRTVAGMNGWPGRTSALSPEQIRCLGESASVPPDGKSAVELTDADIDLLPVLARDGRTSYTALAAATSWSESTVRRRIEELRRSGMLYFVVEVDPLLFGCTMEAVLWVTIAPSKLASVAQALSKHEEIAFAATTTGPTNIVSYVVCRDADALYGYLVDRIGSLSGVLQVETAPIVHCTKRAGSFIIPSVC